MPGPFWLQATACKGRRFLIHTHPPKRVEEGSVWRRVWLRHGAYEMAVGLSPKAMHSAMNGRQHTLLENSLVELGDGWWVLSNGME